MILAIDTATLWTGLALHDGMAVVTELGWRSAQNQTVELAPAVSDVLRRAGVGAAELEGIAVSLGPGSYTGLRVGMALAKGLALANQTPLIGVPTLDIVAASLGGFPGRLMAVVEAGRTRICAAPYEWRQGKGWLSAGDPLLLSWPELLKEAAAHANGPLTFAGEVTAEAARQIREHRFHVVSPAAAVRRAGHLAEIGWRRLRKRQVDDPAKLTPIYLREPAGE